MKTEDIILIMVLAVSYFLFSNEFFKFSAEIKKVRISYPARTVYFFFVYLWFLAASYLELPLVVNWFIFLAILGLEVHLAFSFDFLVSYSLSLFCVIMGLAVNVFFRCLASILLGIPLHTFDNNISTLKSYPIFLGFMVMVFLLYFLRRVHFPAKLNRMLRYRKSLVFYTWTEIFIYLFLMVQLLVFTQSGNGAGIKAWGIKSALFSVAVLVITVVYALRVASLHYYMDMQHEIHNHLIQEKQDVNKLWMLAYTDMLTGCHNRQLLKKRLEEYSGYGSPITLAFIDVNGLKATNDNYGHMEGDHYLIDVSKFLFLVSDGHNIDLFRYGGDEFVMMSNTLGENEMSVLLDRANELLKNSLPQFSRSISYGVVHGSCSEYRRLIAAADEKMYHHKLKYYETAARS